MLVSVASEQQGGLEVLHPRGSLRLDTRSTGRLEDFLRWRAFLVSVTPEQQGGLGPYAPEVNYG